MNAVVLSTAVIADDAEVLRAIREEDVAIAIWERSVPDGITGLALTGMQSVRFQSATGALAHLLPAQLVEAGIGSAAARAVLAEDIGALANRFAAIMDAEAVEIRLEHVTTNACRKFHADYVTARLICTYAGPGTQWLDGADAANCDCGGLHDIRQLNAGDVAIFKGRHWSEDAPAIHRSPPIEGTGEARLVLVINVANHD